MRDIAKFTVGSAYFFDGMRGFSPKDTDSVHIMTDWNIKGECARVVVGDNDMFLYKDKGLELITECIKQDDPVTAGKFLVPEFCRYIGATLDDIKTLEPLYRRIDNKHKYEEYIYDCYVKNGDMRLTESQKAKAYEIYLNARR